MNIERCFDKEGRLAVWPMRKRKALREPILDWLAAEFPEEKDLTEKQVNELIESRTAVMDFAYFRRMLVDSGRLCRTPYGDRYWRPEGSLSRLT